MSPNGLAYPHCTPCVAVQTWTCQGNTYLFSNSGPPGQFSSTLVDSNHMQYNGIIATRIGGRATAVKSESNEPQNAKQETVRKEAKKQEAASSRPVASSNNVMRKSASCSDITGTNSTAPAANDCKDADRSLYAARGARQSAPNVAAQEYKKAAAAARRAGDSDLELSILREATSSEINIASAPSAPAETPSTSPRAISGASSPESAPASGGSIPKHWQGTSQPEDCSAANDLEIQTAAYFDTCQSPVAPETPARYLPPIDPHKVPDDVYQSLKKQCDSAFATDDNQQQRCLIDAALNWRAKSKCQSLTADPRQERKCIKNEKIIILWAEDPDLEARGCGNPANSTSERNLCIDVTYLYGPDDETNLEAAADAWTQRKDKPVERLADYLAGRWETPVSDKRCFSGKGVKPDVGGFGSWSCQPLDGIYTAPDGRTITVGSTEAVAAEQAIERRINQISALTTIAATKGTGASRPTPSSEACMKASFVQVHGVLKGGSPAAAPGCGAMVKAARAELAFYVSAHIDTGEPGVEELLAYLSTRNLIAGGTRNERQADCVRRGGIAASCSAALEAPPSVQSRQPKAAK